MLFYNKTGTIKNLNKHIELYMQKTKATCLISASCLSLVAEAGLEHATSRL